MWAMRSKLTVLERRTMPMTVYPFERSNSAKYEPSWPVMPVISARFAIEGRLLDRRKCSSAGVSRGHPYSAHGADGLHDLVPVGWRRRRLGRGGQMEGCAPNARLGRTDDRGVGPGRRGPAGIGD